MDLVIRNGTVVTAGEISQADVGIEARLVKQIGHIGQMGMDLGPAAKEIGAKGCYLFPGGVQADARLSDSRFRASPPGRTWQRGGGDAARITFQPA